jgi:hypothetical protein
MTPEDLPALYRTADESSADAQRTYLLLLRLQYGLLFAAAVIALWHGSTTLYVAYALVVAGSSVLLIYMSVKKPEGDWYDCRAFAESIKTSAWRYMMRAEPFVASDAEVKRKFADFLKAILEANSHVREPLAKRPVTGEQITAPMDAVRALPLRDRKDRYRQERIADQQDWYIAKVGINRRQFRVWVTLCVLVQVAAITLAVLRIVYDQAWTLWPTEPLLVLASSIIGWIQIKKFNELASAYNLTAHEIGIIATRIDGIATEAEFSEFVNEAERAFSREHTQWAARQTHNAAS